MIGWGAYGRPFCVGEYAGDRARKSRREKRRSVLQFQALVLIRLNLIRLDVRRTFVATRAVKHRKTHDDQCSENGKNQEQPQGRFWNTMEKPLEPAHGHQRSQEP